VQSYLVGITGGSASGKTSFLISLKEAFLVSDLCIISQDHYYHPPSKHIYDVNGKVNFDLPESIDYIQFINDLQLLKAGKVIERKEYLYQNENMEAGVVRFEPARIIVIEGLFIFWFEEIFKMLDLKVFIDAADDIKLERRLRRDTTERGISHDLVLYQWHNHVLPAYEKYLLPFKHAADMIINNNEHFQNSLQILKKHFTSLIQSDSPPVQ
jgi:uridine kinase